MKIVSVLLPERYIQELDQLVAKKMYSNRSEVIRAAVCDMLADEVWSRVK